MCYEFLSNFCLKQFSFQEEFSEKDQKGLHVMNPLFWPDFNET